MNYLSRRDFIWTVPLALALGAVLASLQPGNWFIGWMGFSTLFLICFLLLTMSTRWAGVGTMLVWLVGLAFILRFVGGVATYLLLPTHGFDDEDDRAGFVYTDARRRDAQAWDLASSGDSIFGGFNQSYAYDQYGGLLTFSAFLYRYLSPDEHRPLMLVLFSGFMAALAVPFLWKAVHQQWGEQAAMASGWIYALYPESILLGGSAMREPYLMAFSAFSLWGFVDWQASHQKRSLGWLAVGIIGMLFVSPVVALVSLVIFSGWMFIASGRGRIPWWMMAGVVIVFIAGLFLLSSALDRQGNLGGGTPVGIINNFVREAVKWDVYQLERGSGWVQKLFDEMPEWLRLPFVMVYGMFQPVLPAALVEPTTVLWRVIAVLRSVGWYALLPVLILSVVASAGLRRGAKRTDESAWDKRLWFWLSFVVWGWILFASLRGGGDQWDNPRYRTLLFVWEAILAGLVWVWWRETRNAWLPRVVLMELVFIVFFGQWYASRYFKFGNQLSFGMMVLLILTSWAAVFLWGLWRDSRQVRV